MENNNVENNIATTTEQAKTEETKAKKPNVFVRMGRAVKSAARKVKENPLLAGAIGFVAGAASTAVAYCVAVAKEPGTEDELCEITDSEVPQIAEPELDIPEANDD